MKFKSWRFDEHVDCPYIRILKRQEAADYHLTSNRLKNSKVKITFFLI